MDGAAAVIDKQTLTEVDPAWRWPVRLLLLVEAGVGLALLAGGVPARLSQLRTVCMEDVCPALTLVPADVAYLAELGISPAAYAVYQTALEAILVVPVAILWFVLFRRNAHTWIGVLACMALVYLGVSLGNIAWAWAEAHATVALIYGLLGEFAGTALVLFLFLFPDGRMVPRWVRICIGVELFVILPYGIVRLFLPDSAALGSVDAAELALELTLIVLAVVAQVIRYRRLDSSVQRQQTKWVVMGIAALISSILLWFVTMEFAPFDPGAPRVTWNLLGMPLLTALAAAFPVALGLAILRYRLWNVDLIINRTLVYGTLTLLLIALYSLIVVALSNVLHNEDSFLVSLVATGVVAVAFQPLRMRMQDGFNRWLFGERDDPAGVLTRLTSQLEAADSSGSLLSSLVETIATSLKLPYVALYLQEGESERLAVAKGEHGAEVEAIPLFYQQDRVGNLVVAPRSPGEALSAADRSLLSAIARLTATTVRTIQLTDDVQAARVRTVAAREEERRRLRRDLHDGLGPVLASQGLKLAAARQMLRDKPEVAEQLLDDVMLNSQSTVVEIRRLVYALRPPTLDELGLVEAICEHVDAVAAAADVHIQVDAPDELPEIPAAIEVAAFRIVQEALNNVIRHAQANRCTVTLGANEALHVRIEDDGVGLPDAARSGVGMQSMRERAAEVGGSCEVGRGATGGTCVRLSLPLMRTT